MWPIIFLISLFISFTHCQNGTRFDFFPRETLKIKTGELYKVIVNVSTPLANGRSEYKNIYSINVEAMNPNVATLVNISSTSLEWIPCDVERICADEQLEFEIKGVFVGYAEFRIFLNSTDVNLEQFSTKYRVGILRPVTYSLLSDIFTYTMTVLVCINTFVMGLQLDWKVILQVLKRPIAPAIGFACQFVIMPLVAFGWASLLMSDRPSLQFGYFAVGCAPGGGNSNFWTLLLAGNLDLSVTMTFCSNMAALAMMPFWLFTLGQIFFNNLGGQVTIPFTNILLSLVFLIVPSFLGILVKHFKPTFAEKSKKVIKISTLVVIAVAIGFGTFANIYVFSLITWKTVVCGMLLPYCGFALAYAVAFVLRQDARNCRTIAIETGIQNAAIAIVLLNFSLPKPDSDLTLVMPVCVLLFTPIPLILAFVCKVIYGKLHKSESDAKADEANSVSDTMKAEKCEEVTKEKNMGVNVGKFAFANPVKVVD